MQDEINDFVRNVQMLKMIKNDVTLAKYSVMDDEKNDLLLQLELIEKILATVNDVLITTISNSLDSNEVNNLSLIADGLTIAIAEFKTVKNFPLFNQEEIIEILQQCQSSFAENNFREVIKLLHQDQQKFYKQIISLKDTCLEYHLSSEM